jgi:hypothetical protein
MALLRDEVLTKHRVRIADLAERWSHISHGPRRYDLLAESDECSVWLLGWRPGEETVDHHVDATPIHGHAESSALITCLFGAVENDEYAPRRLRRVATRCTIDRSLVSLPDPSVQSRVETAAVSPAICSSRHARARERECRVLTNLSCVRAAPVAHDVFRPGCGVWHACVLRRVERRNEGAVGRLARP